MTQGKTMKVLNVLLAFFVFVLFFSGLVHEHLSKHAFLMIHVLGGLLLVVGTIIHLIMNWGWIKSAYFKKSEK